MFRFDFGAAPRAVPPMEPVAPAAAAQYVPLAQWPAADRRVSYSRASGALRRDLYDIMYELKARSDLNPEEQFLLESHEDVRKNVYEGGLKVWEGALDLIDVLAVANPPGARFLELGCGGGLPLCALLARALRDNSPGTFVFADYNAAVLSLATLPNIALAYLSVVEPDHIGDAGELVLDAQLLSQMLADFKQRGIEVAFVSGGWSSEFSKLVGRFDVVLASETIYSLDTLPAFTDVLCEAIVPRGAAYVAAKRVYFGVGGGVVEFERLLDARGVKHDIVLERGNVGRVVLQCYL